VLCAALTANTFECIVLVADDDNDPSPDPTGNVALFRNAISSDAFLAQGPLFPRPETGISVAVINTPALPAGTSTIWAVYYPTNAYVGSVDSDQVTV
jgi:hypothetical protein